MIPCPTEEEGQFSVGAKMPLGIFISGYKMNGAILGGRLTVYIGGLGDHDNGNSMEHQAPILGVR